MLFNNFIKNCLSQLKAYINRYRRETTADGAKKWTADGTMIIDVSKNGPNADIKSDQA